jgi:hypothetical protein
MRMIADMTGIALGGALAFGATAAFAQAPVPRPCPGQVGAGVSCFTAQDANGAHVLIARPDNANGGLVVHIHGGPRMAPPSASTSDEDLVRFVETVREGYAWVATSRRRGGFGVTQGAEDAENARRLYVTAFGRPALTFVHGQSWGGAVGAILIEKFNQAGPDGRRPYDGALLTAGVLAGGVPGYDARLDLRAAFQVVCGTHPRPDEPQYSLGIGLPPGSRLTRAELEARFNACTGANRPQAERTPEQSRALSDLAAASRIPQGALFGHLWWMTNVAQDIAQHITGGRSPFSNVGVVYRGTSNDADFNARVPRVEADPAAFAALASDSNPTGRFEIPVLSMHAIHDSTVFVESQSVYRQTVERAGNSARLVQVYVDDREHSKVSPPHYPTLLAALRRWVESGERPAARGVAEACGAFTARHPGECRFLPDFTPQPWSARVNARPSG